MRKILIIPRLIGFGLLILTLTLLSVATASAQAPDNDDFSSATPITSLPFESSINTSEATIEDTDPVDLCFEQNTGATVWYTFTPEDDRLIVIDLRDSDYLVTLFVFTGSPGSFDLVTCGSSLSGLDFAVTGGTTYFFMVGAYGGGPGGNLALSINGSSPPPPFTMQFHLEPEGSVVAKTGEVTLSGTITCSRAAYAYVSGRLEQRVGRALIKRFFDLGFPLECNGETPWSATFSGLEGRFGAGKARALVTGYAEPVDGLSPGEDETVDTTVQLKGKQ